MSNSQEARVIYSNPRLGEIILNNQFQFTLLENSLDFILTAVKDLSGELTSRELKYSVLHLSAGVELLLKARLEKHHWSLVFEDMNKANQDAYKAGEFNSVGWKTSIKRLRDNCGVKIPHRSKDAIKKLREKRNRLEHFSTSDSTLAVKASTARVLNFVVDFTTSEFGEKQMSKKENSLLIQIREGLGEFEYFVNRRMSVIQKDLVDPNIVVVECPHCMQSTMIVDNGGMCKFCGYTNAGDKAADEYVQRLFKIGSWHLAHGGTTSIYRCPECWAESLVDVGGLSGEFQNKRFVCFSCGNTWDWDKMSFCTNCGNPFEQELDELIMCDDCYR